MDLAKKDLRKFIKKEYSEINQKINEDRARLLFKSLCESQIFKSSKHILAFWSLADEPSTHQFCNEWSSIKKIYLPVIQGDSLIVKQFTNESELEADKRLGIPEPQKGHEISPETIDLILVPGMAFDLNGNRLGRGKGFYDRFLPNTKAHKIGICFKFQIVERVPTEEFDVKMDEVFFV